MNRLCVIVVLLLATAINVDAKNCKKGKSCGGSCISMNKECHVGTSSSRSSSSGGSSSSYSSGSSSPTRSYSYSAKPQITYAKNCKKGKPCGDSCIAIDKECNVNSTSSSSSSDYSSSNSSPETSYSPSAKPQITYQCNGAIVSESEYKKCKSAQQDTAETNEKITIENSTEEKITNSPATTTVVVAEILDADIFQCSGKKKQKIRLYGIDAPEDGQAFFQEAKDMLRKFIHKKKIAVKIYSNDSDGANAAVVFANGKNVNELMVISGYAWVHTGLCTESFCDNWIESEDEAKSQGKGLWSDPGRLPPWVWR